MCICMCMCLLVLMCEDDYAIRKKKERDKSLANDVYVGQERRARTQL